MIKRIFILLFLTILSGCQFSDDDDMTPVDKKNEWFLLRGDDHGKIFYPQNDYPVTLIMTKKDELSGNAGINHYVFPVTIDKKHNITFSGDGFVTRMGGEPSTLGDEYRYLHMLKNVNHFNYQQQNLILTGEGIELIYQKTAPFVEE